MFPEDDNTVSEFKEDSPVDAISMPLEAHPEFSRIKQEELRSAVKEDEPGLSRKSDENIMKDVDTDSKDVAAADRAEKRRRMDEIVKEHIRDLHVYDKPSSTSRNTRGTSHAYFMSGAIPTGSSDNLLSNTIASATATVSHRSGVWQSARIMQSRGTPRMEESTIDEPFIPSSPTVHAQKRKAQRPSLDIPAKPVHIRGPLTQSFTPKRIPKVTPVFAPTIPELVEYAKTSSSGGKGEKDESPIRAYGNRKPTSSDHIKSSVSTRKETPIPVPQPWKNLLQSSG